MKRWPALILALALPAASAEPAFDPLAELFTRDATTDEAAAKAIPERGETLARLTADLTLAAQGLEAFRSPDDATKALKYAPERVPAELRPRFSSREQALDTLYRTLAVADYTWATRFSDEKCSASDRRARILSSADGLFKDPKTGETSPWLVHLLGPEASQNAEAALDKASAAEPAKGRDYELLRAKVAKITAALAAAPEDKRAWLHCLRAETYETLARANQVETGPITASRGTIPSNGVALIGKLVNGVFEAYGSGVLLKTKDGERILTDSRLVQDETDLQAAFSDTGKPIKVRVERKGPELAILSSSDDLGEGRELSASDPAKDDLVTVISNSERLGAWAWTQGLVSDSQDGIFQTDAVVDAGQAGGAVLDESGRVAGLLTLQDAEAEDGEGQWPVGIPASKVKAWLEGRELQAASRPIALQDAGTSSIIQASYIYSQTQWGAVRGKCVANCGGGSSYSRGYSSNPGAEALGRAMGEAIGQGVRALFKGLGSMFRSKGQGFAQRSPKPRSAPVAKAEKPKPVEPPKPSPKPVVKCELLPEAAPSKAGVERFEVTVRLDCNGGAFPLAGHTVSFAFDWDGKKDSQTAQVKTDAQGRASLVIKVENEQTKLFVVKEEAENSHAQLDAYDPAARDPNEPEESWQARQKEKRREEGALVETGSQTTEEQKASGAAPAAVVAGTLARPLILRGSGAVLRVTATVALSPATVAGGSVIVSLAAAKTVFDIGWAIGSAAERELSDIQRGLKRYDRHAKALREDEENDCEFARNWQRERAGIGSEHRFKDEWGAIPNKHFDICACKDGRIVIRAHESCGKSGPTIVTDRRWK